MSKVREWLEAIGLVQYADAFEANDIDIDLLGQVDDQMLKDIGVPSAGHRLRIRNAIAKLSPASPLAKNENATSTATEPKTQERGCQLLGSDRLMRVPERDTGRTSIRT